MSKYRKARNYQMCSLPGFRTYSHFGLITVPHSQIRGFNGEKSLKSD